MAMQFLIITALLLIILVAIKRKAPKSFVEWNNLRRVRDKLRQEHNVPHSEIPIENTEAYVVWEEPNRAETPTLHIGGSGERYSTLTGVAWLDNDSFIVNHRSGLSIAIFKMNDLSQPIWKSKLDFLTDDIAAKRIDEVTWEICVSGCWANIYGRYQITKPAADLEKYQGKLLQTLKHDQKDFCHGVAYDDDGQLCYSIHTGKKPRLNIGGLTYRLPAPWGVRDLCYDSARERYIAVAVSANPRRAAYGGVKTTLWTLENDSINWECLGLYDNVHSDALDVWRNQIWIPDQVNNRLIAVDAKSGCITQIYTGDSLNFPHGLGISPTGTIAITNYGTSSVAIVDAERLLRM